MSAFHRPTVHWIRRVVQLAFMGLFLFLAWAATYPATGSENLFLRVDPLAGAAASRGGILLYLLPAWILLGLTLVSGRFFCAWVCPLGTCLEMLPSIGKKRRRRLSTMRAKSLRGETIKPGEKRLRLKYLFLVILLGLLLAGINLAWLFDPLVISNRAFVFVTVGSVPFILIALGLLAVFVGPRFWCQEMCPLGAGLSLTAWLGSKLPAAASPLALVKADASCTHCGKCAKACPFEIVEVTDSRKSGRLALADCALCGECVLACPEDGALRLQVMGNTVLGSKRVAAAETAPKEVAAS